MAKYTALMLLMLVLVVGDVVFASRESHDRRKRRDDERRQFEDLRPRNPREEFRSEGGRIEAWEPKDLAALCDAEVGVKRLTLEPQGLATPCYKDAPVLKVVTRGSARAGIINPLSSDKLLDRIVFTVRKGDVIALPRGVASWLYNDGNEPAEILEVGDSSNSGTCGCFKSFQLAGGKQSVLGGFSAEGLAHAWDVDEGTVRRVLEGQKGGAIIKVDRRRMRMPEETSETNTLFMDFVYRLDAAHPDLRVRNGGEVRFLNSLKFPILKAINLAAACVKMEQGAITAPAWIHNANKVVYVTKGCGRIQIVRENGEQALDARVEEGSLVIIPSYYPSLKLAGERGFEYAAIYTNDMPIESYLAGRNSVYKGMPDQVQAQSFQIDGKLQQKFSEGRTEESYLFPPRREGRGEERRGPSLLETLVGVL